MADVQTTTYSTRFDAMTVPDIDETIRVIAPTETPFIASIGMKKTTNTNPRWNEDDLAMPAENAQLEGDDAVATAYDQPRQFNNYTQIFRKVYRVSGTSDAVEQYGKAGGELAYARGKAIKELGRDLEYNFLNNQGAAGTTSTPRKLRGAVHWVDTASDAYYDFAATPAATNHITENLLNDVMQAMFEKGVLADTVLAPPAQKRKISGFTFNGRVTINADQSARKIQEVVNVFETDFGVVNVKPEMFMAATESSGASYDKVLVYSRDIFVRRVLRPSKRIALAVTGDSRKEMVVSEQTLQCKSSKGVGVLANLSRVPVSA